MSRKELISKIELRADGRRANELRRIRCKLGVFREPDGSAYLEQGLTKVLAAVYGPHQVRRFILMRSSLLKNFSRCIIFKIFNCYFRYVIVLKPNMIQP